MATTIADLVDGLTAREGSDGSLEFERTCVVAGIAGATSGPTIIAAAFAALDAAGYVRNSTWSSDYPFAVLKDRSPTVVSLNACKVRLTYRQLRGSDIDETPEGNKAQITVGSSVVQSETDKDFQNEPLWVQYHNKYHTFSHQPFLLPQVTMSASRVEQGSPGQKAIEFVGKVNSGGWSLHPQAAWRTWLCTGIVGTSTDGITYDVNYTFQYDPNMWDVWLQYTDPATGQVPADVIGAGGTITEENVRRRFQLYQTANFNDLGL